MSLKVCQTFPPQRTISARGSTDDPDAAKANAAGSKQVESTTRCESGERRLRARDWPLKQGRGDDLIAWIAVRAGRSHRPACDAASLCLQGPFHGTSTNTAGLRLGFSSAEATGPAVFPSSNSSRDKETAFAVLPAIEVMLSRQTSARSWSNRPTASDLRTSRKRNSSKPTTRRKTVRGLSNFERTESSGPNPSETSRASDAQSPLIKRWHSCRPDSQWQSLIYPKVAIE